MNSFVIGILPVSRIASETISLKIEPAAYWACIALAVAVGAIDELHQSLIPTRMMDWHDLLADTVGILVFTWIWLALKGSGLFIGARVRTESEN